MAMTEWELIADLTGPEGQEGPMGPGGPGSVPADTAIGGFITAPGDTITKTALAQAIGVIAPAPTGVAATDTANLQAAITQAQTTYGTVFLQAGTYKVNSVSTSQSFDQPKIIGKGKSRTFIQGMTAGSALMFKGGSGALSGGYLSDITFTGTGVGLEFQGVGGVGWDRLGFATLSTGILFHNKDANEFTEYCAGQADFESTVTTAVEYKVTGGVESFHGSGLTGQSTINQSATATSASIVIGAGCVPYNAPLDVTFWVRVASQAVMRNNSARPVTFHGTARVETFTTGAVIAETAAGATSVTLVGSFLSLGATSGTVKLGRMRLAERAEMVVSGINVTYKPSTEVVTVGPTLTAIHSQINAGHGQLVHVTLVGANYYYVYLLHVESSLFDSTGVVTVLANPYLQNTAGWGAPVFSVSGAQIRILNAAYPAAAVTATTTWTPLGNKSILS